MSTMDLTRKIPIALNNILKEDQYSSTKLFHNSLPCLLLSYGTLCAERGDNGAYAEIPVDMKRSLSFWSAMSHHHSRSTEETARDAFFFWLGFCPTLKDEKRIIIDEAARLLTQQHLTNDFERDDWLDLHGASVFPGYSQYHDIMKLR